MHLETLLSRLEMQMNMWKSRPWTRFSAQRLRSFSLNQEVDVPRPAHQSLRKRTRKWASGQVGGCSSALLFPLPSKDNYEPRDSPPPPPSLKSLCRERDPAFQRGFHASSRGLGKTSNPTLNAIFPPCQRHPVCCRCCWFSNPVCPDTTLEHTWRVRFFICREKINPEA